jgi:hypothetical protein
VDKKLKTYQKAILSFLEQYSSFLPANWEQVENQVIADKENHHYQLIRMGWNGKEHIHYALFHFDLREGKILIQENRTDLPIIDELVALGIQKDDIILAFQEMPQA